MSKVVIKFKNGDFINIEADTIEIKNSDIVCSKYGKIVAVAKTKEIISCHLSEMR